MKFLCKVGIHKWFGDSAWFNTNLRCARCLKWQYGDDIVERERAAWEKVGAATHEKDPDKLAPLVLRELMREP